jgi:PLP dependent protein
MTEIKNKIESILQYLPKKTKLIAVSKTHSAATILEAYDVGLRIFGENKAIEMRDKYEILPKDIEWHFIGHLQSNKVKYIAPFVQLIHSVDGLNILEEINKQAIKCERLIDCLLQFHIATEETKFGLSQEEAFELLNSFQYKDMKNIRIVGVMGMATNTFDQELIRSEFKYLSKIYTHLKQNFFFRDAFFNEISMGMSSDFQIAVQEGSTMVRIGSVIFGERE